MDMFCADGFVERVLRLNKMFQSSGSSSISSSSSSSRSNLNNN